MGLLTGRRALVTGAANGIGRAVAERCIEEGATVVGVDVEPLPSALAARTRAAIEADLADAERLPSIVEDVEAAAGPLDALVNVAGIFEPHPALEMPVASYHRVLAVNLHAPVRLCLEAGRGMVERGYGRIVNITSIHGEFGEPQSLSYDTAKAGLNQATRTLAIEFGPHGVLVNALAPGFVRTRMSVVNGEDELESDWFRNIYVTNGKLPLRRAAEPSEIASHVAWLCSEQNTYLTGQVVTVDGGLTVTF